MKKKALIIGINGKDEINLSKLPSYKLELKAKLVF